MSPAFSIFRFVTVVFLRIMRLLSPLAWRYNTLDIRISGEIPEELPQTGWVRRFYRARNAFRDYLFALREVKEDPNLKFVVFHIKNPDLGWGRVSELRGAIRELRDAGLTTIAFLESADNISYYLASACDEIFLAPSGQVMLRGLATEVFFFKGILDKIKVKADFMHVGKYKSASELFTRKSMSQAHREEIDALLDNIFDTFIKDLATDRRLTEKEMVKLIDQGSFLAKEAKRSGLVDGLYYEDQLGEVLEEHLGRRLRRADAGRYSMARFVDMPLRSHFRPRKRVALLYANGPISMGESTDYAPSGPSVGAESITDAIRQIRESGNTIGAVIRVSSPGGSALASDLIWREIALGISGLNRADNDGKSKPIIASMGDVAASGGYYIACPADKIFASSATVTGSIGVVGGKFNIGGLLDSIGVGIETVTRGKSADRDSMARSFSQQEKKRVKEEMEAVYDDFVDRVALGRKLKNKQVQKLAQGRVWTGSQALQKGLVDNIGGMMAAIDEVKSIAGIPKGEKVFVDIYPRRKKFIRLPGMGASGSLKKLALRKLAEFLPKDVQAMIPLLRSDEPLAIMPYRLKIY